MKQTKYPEVEKLKPGSVKVSQYAKDNNCTVSWVYTKHDRGQATYKIVQFQGINFVQPN